MKNIWLLCHQNRVVCWVFNCSQELVRLLFLIYDSHWYFYWTIKSSFNTLKFRTKYMALVSVVFLVSHIFIWTIVVSWSLEPISRHYFHLWLVNYPFLLTFYVNTNAEMEITSRSQRWSRKTSQPINANRKGLDKRVLVFSIQVTVRTPILHTSISRFPHHLVPALPTQNYYLSNKSWSINNKTKYFTNILTSQWKCQSMATWSMYIKFWSSIRSVLRDQISCYWRSHLLNCIIVTKKYVKI